MKKLLLDTNVLSEPEFLKWLKDIEDAEKYMSSITLMEFAYHLLKKGKGEREAQGLYRALLNLKCPIR